MSIFLWFGSSTGQAYRTHHGVNGLWFTAGRLGVGQLLQTRKADFPGLARQFRHTTKAYQDFWTFCGIANSCRHAAPRLTDISFGLLQSLNQGQPSLKDCPTKLQENLSAPSDTETCEKAVEPSSLKWFSFYWRCSSHCPSQVAQAQKSKMSAKNWISRKSDRITITHKTQDNPAGKVQPE